MKPMYLRYATRNALIWFLVVTLLTAILPAVANYDNPSHFWTAWSWVVFDRKLGVLIVLVTVAVFLTSLRGPKARRYRGSDNEWGMGKHGEFVSNGYDVQGRPFGLDDN